jgi:hypothetical protein
VALDDLGRCSVTTLQRRARNPKFLDGCHVIVVAIYSTSLLLLLLLSYELRPILKLSLFFSRHHSE